MQRALPRTCLSFIIADIHIAMASRGDCSCRRRVFRTFDGAVISTIIRVISTPRRGLSPAIWRVVVLRSPSRRIIIYFHCAINHSAEIGHCLTIRIAKRRPSAPSVVAPDPALFLGRLVASVASHSQTAAMARRSRCV
jgi:hypothetical protein